MKTASRTIWGLDHPAHLLYSPASNMQGFTALQQGAQIAQLVEHATENRNVAGSIPALGTILFLLCFLPIWAAGKVT